MRNSLLVTVISSALAISACTDSSKPDDISQTQMQRQTAPVTDVTASNPLLLKSRLQYEAPDFTEIKDEHFLPAFEAGIKQQITEVLAIASNPAPATFDNTLLALEQSGELLTRVSRVFYNLAGSSSTPQRRHIQSELAPKMAAHADDITLNPQLFARIKRLHQQRHQLSLDSESQRLIDVYYQRFVRAGAQLTAEQKTAIRALNEEHSTLTNQFSQNLLAETNNIAVLVDDDAELAGLASAQLAAARLAAAAAGHPDKYLLSLTNTTRQPILSQLHNRPLRQRIWQASANRNQSGTTDNRKIVGRITQLRAERARLLGYDNWASYAVEYQMANSAQAVFAMLGSMVPAVLANTQQEANAIQAMVAQQGDDIELQPWDWEYYADQVRQARYQLDENEVKPYFEFNRVLHDGVFYTFERLFGIRFVARPDLPTYHPDVSAYELFDADGSSLALFYADYFARDGKRGGAWMSSFVGQSRLTGQKPVVVNVMNIAKAPQGEPTLLSFENVTTMFHELGHGLHGMLSDVTYPTLSGTAVARDFVEFPSTFQEDWAAHPEVIANYAKHYKTGEPITTELLKKVMKSRSFNQGYDTLEYLSAALLDMEWHSISADEPVQDVNAFETAVLNKHGINLPAVSPRYKSTFFSHAMGGGYAAGYYAYMWSEVLAADAFAYVQQQGGLTRINGQNYRKHILATGNSRPPMASYKAFRGQEPSTDALLIRRGLKEKVD
jgi:peptidyl-dipeptidase Dcp